MRPSRTSSPPSSAVSWTVKMGANVQSSGGADRRARRGRRRGKHRRVMAEINVTPFVDVMLVLLIIFMVAAPLSVVGVPVELSQTAAKSLEAPEEEPLAITINAEGQVFLQTTEIARDDLIPAPARRCRRACGRQDFPAHRRSGRMGHDRPDHGRFERSRLFQDRFRNRRRWADADRAGELRQRCARGCISRQPLMGF